MKTSSIPSCATVLATGSILVSTCLTTLRPVTAQDATPRALPTPAAEPAKPTEPTMVEPPAPPAPPTAGAPTAQPRLESVNPAAPPLPTPPRETPIELSRSAPLSRQIVPGGLPGASGVAGRASGQGNGSRVSVTAETFDPQPDRATSSRIVRFGRGAGGGADSLDATFADTILNEEALGSPQDAARHYEAVLAQFDGQRANAAQAVFRLGESYRKLGRPDEARIQYARILREFVDFPDLASLSQQQLAQALPRQRATLADPTYETAATTANAEELARNREAATRAVEEERALLQEEISLLEHQLAETRARFDQGAAPSTQMIPLQREILQLKRQLLRRQILPDSAPQAGAGDAYPPAATGGAGIAAPLPTPAAVTVPDAEPPVLQKR